VSEEKELPKGWVLTSLERIAEIRDDLRLPINADERAKRLGLYPYYGATGQVGWIDSYLMDGEYVLLGEDGAPFLDPFKSKAYLISGKCWVNNHAHVLRGIEGLSANRFLMHVLNAANYREVVNGTTRLKLTQSAMRQMLIPLPPLPEQHRIVAAIEQQFTRLDAGVAALQRAKARLKRYRAAVLKAAVEGKLTETWRVEHPTTEPASLLLERILDERRTKWEADLRAKGKDPAKVKYVEPAAPNIENLPELPEGWCWVRSEQLCGFITKGTTPSAEKLYSRNGEIPFIKVYNLTSYGHLDFTINPTFINRQTNSQELSRSRVFPGDVLMNIVGPPLGKVSIVPPSYPEWNVNQAIAIFRPMSNYSRNFLCLCLLSEPILSWAVQRAKATAGQFNLTLEICRDLPLPLPPFAEQEQIVAEVERRLSIIDKLEATIETDLKRAERLRQSILREAFAGRLVPQDPTDEPASILLDRIRNERKNGQDASNKTSNGKRVVRVPEPVSLDVAETEQAALWESVER
jgi:type I restriction enzyme S subunit